MGTLSGFLKIDLDAQDNQLMNQRLNMLSKSQYIRGLQCHKSLWLYKHRPELRQEPDAATQALFDMGHTVGDLACELFPGGTEIEFNHEDFSGMAAKTKQLVEGGTEVIYEATFREQGVFAMADILVRETDGWSMYEVKASTKVKNYHLNDAAVQWFALSNAINLKRAFIVHVNKQYVRDGKLDIHQLFTIEDVTGIVESRQPSIPHALADMNSMLKLLEPDIDIGMHCSDPFDCDFMGHCWCHVPDRSVFNLYRFSAKRKFELYQQGVVQYQDLDFDDLNSMQTIQVKTALQNEEYINTDIINDFLGTLEYPLNFFDFETFMEAIPRYDCQRPYSQIPFQYSLHVVTEDGVIEHREFLGDEFSDPREDLVNRMLADIELSGSIVDFNMGFEKRVIKELANIFPQQHDQLLALNDRFVDLIDPFRNLGYYHPEFNGSFSLKSILPAMFPDDEELDYKKLNISDGQMAMGAFANLPLVSDPRERARTKRALLDYCHLDTLAMVKIWLRLKEFGSGQHR